MIHVRNVNDSLLLILLQLYTFYLSESTVDLATKFSFNDKILSTDYKKNCGYLVDNSVGVPHYMNTPVPADHIRYSLYAMWGHRG